MQKINHSNCITNIDKFTNQELYDEIQDCLNSELINIEFISLAYSELRARQVELAHVDALLISRNVKIIRWLNGLRYRINHLLKDFDYDRGRGARHKVYFILLCSDGRLAPPHPWGLYVGQTSRRLEVRLSQHLDPNHHLRSKKVTKRGWDLLNSVCKLVPVMKKNDAVRFEKLVLTSLRGDGREKKLRSLDPKKVKGG